MLGASDGMGTGKHGVRNFARLGKRGRGEKFALRRVRSLTRFALTCDFSRFLVR